MSQRLFFGSTIDKEVNPALNEKRLKIRKLLRDALKAYDNDCAHHPGDASAMQRRTEFVKKILDFSIIIRHELHIAKLFAELLDLYVYTEEDDANSTSRLVRHIRHAIVKIMNECDPLKINDQLRIIDEEYEAALERASPRINIRGEAARSQSLPHESAEHKLWRTQREELIKNTVNEILHPFQKEKERELLEESRDYFRLRY